MSAFMILTLVTTLGYGTVFASNEENGRILAEKNVSEKDTEKKPKVIEKPSISAGSFMVMSGSTSEIVYASREERKLQPGSITKYMTAMVVIDNMYNSSELKNSVVITKELSKYGDTFKEGESIKVEDLLKAMIVGNSDQAAEALASYSASERKIFVSEMNSKAIELGLVDTSFANPSGAYSTGQYSTAADCAVIAQAAIRYNEIKSISLLESCTIKANPKKSKEKPRTVTIESANPLLKKNQDSSYQYIKSGISGSLDGSIQFAGISLKDDMQLIVIMLDESQGRVEADSKALFEYGYSKVSRHTIVKADKKVGKVRIRGGAVTRLPVYTETKGFAYIPPEGSTDLVHTKVVIQKGVEAPIAKGQKVGEFQIYVANELKGTVDLVVKKDVKKGWLPSKIYISNFGFILICIFLFALVILSIRIANVRRQKAKRREFLRRRKIEELARKQMELEEDRRRRNWTYSNFYESDSMKEYREKFADEIDKERNIADKKEGNNK